MLISVTPAASAARVSCLAKDEADADFGGVAPDFALGLDCFVVEFWHLVECGDPVAFGGFGRLGGGLVQRLMTALD
jgi:hypothetical protein